MNECTAAELTDVEKKYLLELILKKSKLAAIEPTHAYDLIMKLQESSVFRDAVAN